MLSLPIYLLGSSYYLHTRIGSKQFKRSLRTNDKKLAIIRATRILEVVMAKQSGDDLLSLNLDKVKKFEIDLSRGYLKSDGPEDHQRMKEALELLKNSPRAPAESIVVPSVVPPATEKGLKLQDLLDKFFMLKSHLKPATAMSYKSTIGELAKFLKNPFIQAIGVSDITRYQEYLATTRKNKARTIDSKVTTIGTMFKFAIKQGYYFDKNPAEGRTILTKKEKNRGGWVVASNEEIEKVYNSEEFKAFKQKDPDFYWTMVLVLVTGCRISEVTSLRAEQLRVTVNGINYVSVIDAKTEAGVREIPIPDLVFKWGLSDFIDGKDKIFKYKERNGKGSGNAVLKRFKRLLEALQITRPKLVVHSIRKFVNDFLFKNHIDLETRCQFIGHEFEHVNVQIYLNELTIVEMHSQVSPVQQKILMLSGLLKTKF